VGLVSSQLPHHGSDSLTGGHHSDELVENVICHLVFVPLDLDTTPDYHYVPGRREAFAGYLELLVVTMNNYQRTAGIGGAMEARDGGDQLTALRRELLEELNFDLREAPVVRLYTLDHRTRPLRTHVYLCLLPKARKAAFVADFYQHSQIEVIGLTFVPLCREPGPETFKSTSFLKIIGHHALYDMQSLLCCQLLFQVFYPSRTDLHLELRQRIDALCAQRFPYAITGLVDPRADSVTHAVRQLFIMQAALLPTPTATESGAATTSKRPRVE
jgi:hypothetical protein